MNRPPQAKRLPLQLSPDESRVITRLFLPGGDDRVTAVLDRVSSLSKEAVDVELQQAMERFRHRHTDVTTVFQEHFAIATEGRSVGHEWSEARRQLCGAYFTSEYSIESVALFNPSIVPHPDQSGVAAGSLRFVMSVRATGENHISSIEFRSGTIDEAGDVTIDPVTEHVLAARPEPRAQYDKHTFFLKLIEMGAYNEAVAVVLDALPDQFTIEQLQEQRAALAPNPMAEELRGRSLDSMAWLARSNNNLSFPPGQPVCEQVIFPVTENDSRGMEDARFVRFTDEHRRTQYYATYTAYNGFTTLPMLLHTRDFHSYRMSTLNGRCVRNKGMALFPRRIDGWYVMLGRMDGENIFLMRSDNIHFWNDSELILAPKYPWEFVQLGNCGSPIETKRGWLVLTHGVGPMRRYCLGACLLDLHDPSTVLGRTREPILEPIESEREGYVPNVVYSCGGLVHNDQLILPYAMSDTSSGFAVMPLDDIWRALV